MLETKNKKNKLGYEKINKRINQPNNLECNMEKTDKYFTINNINVYLYKTSVNNYYYLHINDYINILNLKSSPSKIIYTLKYPEVIYTYPYDNNSYRVFKQFYVTIEGYEKIIFKSHDNLQKNLKLNIYNLFKQCIDELQQINNDTLNTQNENQDTFDFIFDVPNTKSINNINILNIKNKCNEIINLTHTLNNTITEYDITQNKLNQEYDKLNQEYDKLNQEYNELQQQYNELQQQYNELQEKNTKLKNIKYYTVDLEKVKKLNKFIYECEKSTDPFTNTYILNTLTKIINKSLQEYYKSNANDMIYHFLTNFNKYYNFKIMYKDQPREYENEHFVRIALRMHGYKVIEYIMNSEYKDSVLYQFKNKFDINITNNKCILNSLLLKLSKQIKVSIDSDNKLYSVIELKAAYLYEQKDEDKNNV